MRLLRVRDQQFDEFPSHGPFPKYAILSHTWIQPSNQEVSYQDMMSVKRGDATKKTGWSKIRHALDEAAHDRLKYIWIDTCCINKLDPTELTEAINCMYNWYAESTCCYAYLSDVVIDPVQVDDLSVQLGKSQWFTRGWTLQELIAPPKVKIVDRAWHAVTDRATSANDISAITKIPAFLLHYPEVISGYSIANRMSWAAGRRTTRDEDRAYSLLGIFGIVMPLHYGEGEEHAFIRLQQEIIRQDADQSILAWEWPASAFEGASRRAHQRQAPFLAPSPDCFKTRSHVTPARRRQNVAFSISNLGLEIEAYLVAYKKPPEAEVKTVIVTGSLMSKRPPVSAVKMPRSRPLQEHDSAFVGAIINCSSTSDTSMLYMLPLNTVADGVYRLETPMECLEMDWFDIQMQMDPPGPDSVWQKITILRNNYAGYMSAGVGRNNLCARVRVLSYRCPELSLSPWAFWPVEGWNKGRLTFLASTVTSIGVISFRCVGQQEDDHVESFITIAFSPAEEGYIVQTHRSFEAPPSEQVDEPMNLFRPPERLGPPRSLVWRGSKGGDEVQTLISAERVDTPCDGFMVVKVVLESQRFSRPEIGHR